MCRITIDGTISQFSCKCDIHPDLWDIKSNRASGKSTVALETNRFLDKVRVGINAKYKAVTSYVFHGVMFQMSNDVPMFRERSKSVYRCAECLPFEKDFHKGVPRDYIRDDYAMRKETLEYVLFHSLTMFDGQPLDGYTEDVRAYVAPIKMDMRATASKVWEFMDEIEHYLVDWMETCRSYSISKLYIPHRFLYDVFSDDRNGWCHAQGYGHTLNFKNFRRELMVWVEAHKTKWNYIPTSGPSFRVGATATGYVQLLNNYPVEKWFNPHYGRKIDMDIHMKASMTTEMANKVYNGAIEYIG